MKLGVGYIVYTGAEFLKPSLLNIRPFADHIVVILGGTSHSGHKLPPYLRDLVRGLCGEGLIDELVEYDVKTTTVPKEMQGRCREKREVARMYCEGAGCSHFLIKDCDEFHIPDQLGAVLGSRWIEKYDVTISHLVEYWGSPLIRARDIGELCVPFVQRVDLELASNNYGYRVDRGRTCIGFNRKKLIPKNELLMHHFTACRVSVTELERKFLGHAHLNRVYKRPEAYARDVKKLMIQNPTIKVPDIFGIQEYWNTEYRDFIGGYEEG